MVSKRIKKEHQAALFMTCLIPPMVGDRAVIKRTDGTLREGVISEIGKHGWITFRGERMDRRGATWCERMMSTIGIRWWLHKVLNDKGEMIDELF